ncbi:hypothetical protein CLG96_12235 [Sphingomonas oleivorans]|uniref:Uncharacterized protein n=1 Tax=Sphingomonas oleivorans TaxID=1735121 RepID=A0A2T5FVW6_9SPHN|nr:hypothetical protein [Sphingomonas oleivorans]PTQ09921.1 hypothetical protein CLG96_12235 [Sphingomonas oleivorans]
MSQLMILASSLARAGLARDRIRPRLNAAVPLFFILLRFSPEEALLLRGTFDLIWRSGRIGPLRFR